MRKAPTAIEAERLPGAVIRLDRQYPALPVAVPRVIYLQGANLHWSLRDGFDYREPRFETLREFVSLCDEGDASILGFAKKWGVLAICTHGLPISHSAGMVGSYLRRRDRCELTREFLGVRSRVWEALSAWRFYSRQAQLVLRHALAAQEGLSVPKDEAIEMLSTDLEALFPEIASAQLGATRNREKVSREREAESVPALGELVAWTVNRWLSLGHVQPILISNAHPPRTQSCSIAYASAVRGVESWRLNSDCYRLFGALAIQLMQAVSRDTIAAHCRGDCGGRIFERTRSNQVYCERCRKNGARVRLAQQRQYRKRKSGG